MSLQFAILLLFSTVAVQCSRTKNEDNVPLYSWSEWADSGEGKIERSSLQKVKEVKEGYSSDRCKFSDI